MKNLDDIGLAIFIAIGVGFLFHYVSLPNFLLVFAEIFGATALLSLIQQRH